MKKNISYLIAMALVATFSSCKQDLVSMEPVPLNQNTASLAVADSVQTFKVISSASIETDRLQFRAAHNEMQATGFYVAPNSTITVNVKSGTTVPRLAIGTPVRDNIRPVRQYFNLAAGTQSFTVDQYGGLV